MKLMDLIELSFASLPFSEHACSSWLREDHCIGNGWCRNIDLSTGSYYPSIPLISSLVESVSSFGGERVSFPGGYWSSLLETVLEAPAFGPKRYGVTMVLGVSIKTLYLLSEQTCNFFNRLKRCTLKNAVLRCNKKSGKCVRSYTTCKSGGKIPHIRPSMMQNRSESQCFCII